MFKKFGRIAAVTALSLGMALGLGYRAEAMVGGKPVIGISWESTDQESDYAPIKKIIEMAGGIPVELGQIKSTDVQYDKNGAVDKTCLEPSGMLKQKYADKIKDQNFGNTNIATVMQGIDGVFGTGGEDISPSLYKHPEKEKNHGEEINASRDISDYTLQAYCLKNNIPTLNVCRSEQMMGIVSGVKFMQTFRITIKPTRNLMMIFIGCLQEPPIGIIPGTMYGSLPSSPISGHCRER